ncbi:SGNH hydrolase-type esterase domain-containing protein [Rhodocollybia butyracea]|uniref:SGNH hydrolase-type esterase domain-containing protein n=1 Tax=Rhodocollybia butyracea TaxID=206335 RepID=A0A9P5PX71_9AGAR|nr:SGNH hydrolase-type esterase domain-containing protein [Rhodocollybia butyracea]
MSTNVQNSFMLFGDSITQGGWETEMNGFGAKLAHVYARKLDVINRGLSGYNTEWGIPVFEQCFATQEQQKHLPTVRLLLIWFGANDSCIAPSPQYVPLVKFASNLKHLISLVQSPRSFYYSPKTRIILATPPPVNTYQRGADLAGRNPPIQLDREFENTKMYADTVKDIAHEEEVAVVDIWTKLYEAAGREERSLSAFLTDGLHLNGAGYKLMYEAVLETIGTAYPELHPDRLEMVFPPWGLVDRNNVVASVQARDAEVVSV